MNIDYKVLRDYRYGKALADQNRINVNKNISHAIAGKIAQAVWGDKKFKSEIKDINLVSNILGSKDEFDIKKRQNATLERIRKQYGVEVEVIDNG